MRLSIAAIALTLAATQAHAATVRVLAGGAMTPMVREVADAFAKQTGDTVDLVSDTTGGLQKRLRAGEKADVIVMTEQGVAVMQGEGRTAPQSHVNIARAMIGMAVKAGARSPDISSVDALKATLLAAKSVSYVSPASGGVSGTYFEGLLKTLGVAEAVKLKTVYRNQGSEVAAAVAGGEAEVGVSFTGELAPNPGVKVVGFLPPAVQLPTVYTAALTSNASPSGQAFLKALRAPFAAAAINRAGMIPLSSPDGSPGR